MEKQGTQIKYELSLGSLTVANVQHVCIIIIIIITVISNDP